MEKLEKLFFFKYLEADDKGQTIYHILVAYSEDKCSTIINMLTCVGDRAPAMVGRYCRV